MRERFHEYEVIGRLGMGGMAEVLLARKRGDAGYVKLCAVKRVLQHYNSDQAFNAMFIDEAVLAAKFNHPNVVDVFDFGTIKDGGFYLAMEYVQGADLRRIWREAAQQDFIPPADVAVQIAIGMCRGLGYVHNRTDDNGRSLGVIHRDISPHNVLVSLQGTVKVMDFGIAKARVRATRTDTGMIKGKLAYMSPEQVRGEDIDPRTDIFATGICLWEMLTRRRLYTAEHEMQLARVVTEAKCPEVREIVPDVHPDLNDVVKRFLAPAREDRYQTMREAEFALAAVAQKIGVARLEDFMEKALLPETLHSIRNAGNAESTPAYPQTSVTAPMTSHYTRDRGTVHAERAETVPNPLPRGAGVEIAGGQAANVATGKTAKAKGLRWWVSGVLVALVLLLVGVGWGLARRQQGGGAARTVGALENDKALPLPASAPLIAPVVVTPTMTIGPQTPAGATSQPLSAPAKPRAKGETRAPKKSPEVLETTLSMPKSILTATAKQGSVTFVCPPGSVVMEHNNHLGVVMADQPMRMMTGVRQIVIVTPDQRRVEKTFKVQAGGQVVVKCQ